MAAPFPTLVPNSSPIPCGQACETLTCSATCEHIHGCDVSYQLISRTDFQGRILIPCREEKVSCPRLSDLSKVTQQRESRAWTLSIINLAAQKELIGRGKGGEVAWGLG